MYYMYILYLSFKGRIKEVDFCDNCNTVVHLLSNHCHEFLKWLFDKGGCWIEVRLYIKGE